jgi:hypothetical protein
MNTEKFLDEQGRIKLWPSKKQKDEQDALLSHLAESFETGKKYAEREINEVIKARHTFGDHSLLRRELIERGYLGRSPDCREYWKIEKS